MIDHPAGRIVPRWLTMTIVGSWAGPAAEESSHLMVAPVPRISLRWMLAIVALIAVMMPIGVPILVHRSGLFDGTVYAAGYDESRFRRIRPGMSARQVEALMGPAPVRWTTGMAEIWAYADKGHPMDRRYQRRWVHLYLGHVVSRVESREVAE